MSLLIDGILAPLAQAIGDVVFGCVLASIGRALFVRPARAFGRAATQCGLPWVAGFAAFVALWVAAILLAIAGLARLVATG